MNTYKKLAKYIGPYWKDTVFTWLSVFIEVICEVGVVFMMQFLIDEVKAINGESTQLKLIAVYSGGIALLAIIAAITGILAGYFAASASAGFGKNLRKAMYDRIQDYSFKNIDKFSTSSIVTRTTTDVTNVQNAFMMSIRMVIRAPLLMTFALIMCFVTQWRLAWIFLVIIPVILFLLLYISKKVHPTFVKIFDTYDALNETVEEDVDGIRIVKAFNREKVQSNKFRSVSDFIYKNFIYAEKLLSFNSPIMNTAVYGAMIGISYLGARLIISTNNTEHPFTVGGLSTLITYIMMIMMSLMMISMVYVQIIISKNSTERIVEIIEEVPDIQSPENAIKEVKDGSVDFDNVSFCYHEGKDVLSDIDLHIRSGSMVGIIGSTGSSKTTLVSLMARLYDASKGEVKVGGVNVKEYDLKTLRDKVAVVLQKNTLFTGTIRSNLLWGKEDATDEEIYKACELAQCNEFLSRFPKGLDTEIAQGGTNVSGGQKQRLCIARALLKDPKILILDDSTSACDTHTDSLIREGLQTTKKDVTKFIIAQRVLSIKDCDLILVMDKGRIIARGNNDELMQNCSVYRELYESQLGGGDFDAAE
ncbi:MAG: ABC transporter ATP-binding protein [Candidatus Enterosoma sp.]|nr:ABC transporter ATP-binding protein/permease [Bacilli bacterium]MDD7181075.1 ABC transporter ATP-binding protein [Bacilli bacterium]MDY3048055.1 ABC transporter ATP-binding protein [Candidatus Enterosoma sp.]